MATRGTVDLPLLDELLDDCMNTSLKAALSSIKAFALSQNGNGHLGILQHHFDRECASILVMGQMGIVGVGIPSELNTPLQSHNLPC